MNMKAFIEITMANRTRWQIPTRVVVDHAVKARTYTHSSAAERAEEQRKIIEEFEECDDAVGDYIVSDMYWETDLKIHAARLPDPPLDYHKTNWEDMLCDDSEFKLVGRSAFASPGDNRTYIPGGIAGLGRNAPSGIRPLPGMY